VSEAAPAPAPAARREPPEPLAVLRAAGVITAEDASGARLHDVSRSHSVTLVELPGGSSFVVKRVSAAAREEGRSLATELYAYRLASWNPELAALLPEPVHLDERNQVVALVAGPGEHLFPAQWEAPGFPSAGLAAALGRSLAALHTVTAGLPPVAVATCGVVHLPDTPPEERQLGGGSAAGEEAIEAIVSDPALAASLRRTAALLEPGALVHGDVKWDNALLDPGPPAAVKLFDWELSGWGDPAWDVGAALADTVALAVRLHGAPALADDLAEWLSPALEALLAAYAPCPGERPAERIAGCWIARTVHLALECAATIGSARHQVVEDLLDAARRMDAGHDALAAGVDEALASGT
jgi:aminoglycoside phosphotransferase (APT) family kinase protein